MPPEEYGLDCANKIPAIVAETSEMLPTERAFVTGLIMHHQPQKILELGVSSGSGTAVILNAIRDFENARLFSIDVMEQYWKDKSKPVGWVASTLSPNLTKKMTLYKGKDAVQLMDEIGKADFLVLDTAHMHPIETINFLCVLPYLKDGAIVVVHDISLYALNKRGYMAESYAPRHLYNTIVAEKITPGADYSPLPNIGAFQVTPETRKHVGNLFHLLYLPWGIPYANPWKRWISPELLDLYDSFVSRHYCEIHSKMFKDAIMAQEVIMKTVRIPSFILGNAWRILNGLRCWALKRT